MQRMCLLLAFLATVSCRSSGAPPITDGDLTATIGASEFNATTVFAGFEDKAFTMSAVDEGGDGPRSITLTIRGVARAGTFDLARSGNGGSYTESKSDLTLSWLCATSQGTGSVIITELSSTRIVGTFSFSAPALITSGAVGTKIVTSGSFDVKPWRE